MANREKIFIVVCGDTGDDKVQRYHLATRRTFTDRGEAQAFADTCSPSHNALVVQGDFFNLRRFRFAGVECSSCGGSFGPGDSGFSNCIDHQGLLDEEDEEDEEGETFSRCKRCGSRLHDDLCSDITCPYSDRKQHVKFTEG